MPSPTHTEGHVRWYKLDPPLWALTCPAPSGRGYICEVVELLCGEAPWNGTCRCVRSAGWHETEDEAARAAGAS